MKIMKNILFVFAALALTFANTSCNDPSVLGADLFEGDKLNLQFTDTLTINAVSETPDPLIMYSESTFPLDNLLVGKVKDRVFGLSESRIYSQFRANTTTPDFSTADSFAVYLELPYNVTGVYGDTTAEQKLSVYRLSEEIPDATIYSDKRLNAEATSIGSLTFLPKPNTRELVITETKDDTGKVTKTDTTYLASRIRIKLDNTFAKKLVSLDSSNLTNFSKWLKGLEIRAEKETGCMLSFDLSNATGKTSAIVVYYRKTSATTESVYSFPSSGIIKYANFKHDYTSATIKPYINNQAKSDSLLFLQGMAGVNVKFELPYLQSLGKIVINKAELELTAVNDNTKMDAFPAIEQLLLRTARFSSIRDLSLDGAYITGNNTRPLDKLTTSGGFVRTETIDGSTFKKYHLNLTSHLQLIAQGKEGTVLYLMPHFKEERASRVVLYGLKTPKYRAKLNLTYTKL